MKRLFIAIDPPECLRRQIESICVGIRNIRWVPPAQIHLTLRFIGEVESATCGRIMAGLRAIKSPPLTLKIKGVGHFPPDQSPRVIWLGLEQNDKLVQLRNRIEKSLLQSGLEPEGRKFAPHLTLGRLKNAPIADIRDFMAANHQYEMPQFTVAEFSLYSSRLYSDGPVHQLEASYPLRI